MTQSSADRRAAFEVLRGDIFERLPARDHVDPVSDFRIAGDRADLGVGEPAGQLGNRVARKLRVSVESDNDVAAAYGPTPALNALALPPLGTVSRLTAGFFRKCALTTADVPSVEPSSTTTTSKLSIVAFEDLLDRRGDDCRLVVGGDNDGHEGVDVEAACTLVAPAVAKLLEQTQKGKKGQARQPESDQYRERSREPNGQSSQPPKTRSARSARLPMEPCSTHGHGLIAVRPAELARPGRFRIPSLARRRSERGNAATVCARSPPASCRRTIWPAVDGSLLATPSRTRWTIRFALAGVASRWDRSCSPTVR